MTWNQIFGLKIAILLLKLMNKITKVTTQTMKKREKTCLKYIIFQCNPTDPSFNTHKFLGKINSYITKLHKKEAVNLSINKIAPDYKKIITITKSKELKRYVKSILPTYKEWKTHNQE